MQFEVWTKGLATLAVDCIVLGIFEEGELSGEAQSVDSASSGKLKKLLARGDFPGRPGETLLLTGLGAKKNFARKSWRRAWSAAVAAIARTRIASVAVAIDRPDSKELDDYYFGRGVAEIVGTSLYRVNDLKTAKKPKSPALQKVLAGPVRKNGIEDTERGLEHGAAISAAQKIQRDLANLPGNVCTPSYLADYMRRETIRQRDLAALTGIKMTSPPR